VPTIGYEYQYLTYALTTGPQGAMPLSGPVFGAMFLLNVLEPTSAAEMYVEQGISRSYLVAEFKSLQGNDANLSISGQSFFFGLRFEF
jgi:hypothetical protein